MWVVAWLIAAKLHSHHPQDTLIRTPFMLRRGRISKYGALYAWKIFEAPIQLKLYFWASYHAREPPGFRVSNSRHAAHGTTTCMCMCMLHVTPCLHKQPRVYDPQGAESLPLWLFGQGGGGGLAVLAAVSRPGQGVHRHGGRLRRLPVLVGHAPSHCARRGRALGAEREEGAPRAGVWRPRAVVRPPSHKSTRFAHGLSCCRGGGRHPVRDGRPGARNFSG
jgi:hypothetical protein